MAAAKIEPELGAYTAAQREIAVAAWPMRAAEELRSALIFRAIRQSARAVGGERARAWDRVFARTVGDELRHARICAVAGTRLAARRPVYDLTRVRERLRALPEPRLRLVSLLLVEAALGETVSTALFRAGARLAKEPLTRATLGAIVRDEVGHARLGWRALAAFLDDDLRGPLTAEARRGLAGLEQDVALPSLRRLEAGEPFDPALAELGVLPPEVRVEALYFTVERSLIPRLDALGLDGTGGWRDRWRR
jgi:hypothetical protein